MSDRPLQFDLTWIFGSSRSGSTWLLRMLGERPELRTFNETGLGHHLGVWRPITLAWATANETPALTTFAHAKRSNPDYVFAPEYQDHWQPALRTLLLERIEAGLRNGVPDGRALPAAVIKEPGGSQVADWLVSLVPESRLIFLLRDGRDVVESWLDAHSPGGWHANDFSLAPQGRTAFLEWQATVWRYRTEVVQRVYEAHHPSRRLLVRYEDLRRQPEHELGRMFEILGLAVSEADVAEIVARHSFDRVPESERGTGNFVRFGESGRWRTVLSAEEQAAVAAIIGDKLAELGYAT
jgi:Sulfotransferase family